VQSPHTAISVGSCAGVVTPIDGPIFVGINDSDLTNNRGKLEFQVDVGPPAHLQMWQDGGLYECDGQRANEEAKTIDPDRMDGYGEHH